MKKLKLALRFIFSHKLKYLVMSVATVVFLIMLFPYNDVGDVVTSQVSQQTNNQVYVVFDRLKAGLTSLTVENLTVETPALPAISVQEVTVNPALGMLITQKPEGTLLAKGLFRGDVELHVKPGKRTEAGVSTHVIDLSAQRLNLNELHKVAQLPVMLKGRLNLNTTGTADPTFQEQPDFDINMKIDQFELPASTVETMMGPLNLPELRLSQVELKGRLSAGRFNIERALVGKTGDELAGTIRGGINVQIMNQGRGVQPFIGAYQFEIDLDVKKSLKDKAALFLSFLKAYETPTQDGAQYKFRLNANSLQMPPSMSALR